MFFLKPHLRRNYVSRAYHVGLLSVPNLGVEGKYPTPAHSSHPASPKGGRLKPENSSDIS